MNEQDLQELLRAADGSNEQPPAEFDLKLRTELSAALATEAQTVTTGTRPELDSEIVLLSAAKTAASADASRPLAYVIAAAVIVVAGFIGWGQLSPDSTETEVGDNPTTTTEAPSPTVPVLVDPELACERFAETSPLLLDLSRMLKNGEPVPDGGLLDAANAMDVLMADIEASGEFEAGFVSKLRDYAGSLRQAHAENLAGELDRALASLQRVQALNWLPKTCSDTALN